MSDAPERALEALSAGGAGLLSPGAVALPGAPLGFRSAALVADPDGHALRIRDPDAPRSGEEETP